MNNEIRKIIYIGLRSPDTPRDKIYIEELQKRGVDFEECVDSASGFSKFINVWRKLRSLKGDYDLIWVGYLSGIFVPMAYLAGRRKIIYNALGSAYEAYVLDRAVCGKYSFKAFLFWFSDFLAFHLSSKVLVESEAQKKYLARMFFVPVRKFEVIFTGVDEEIFHPDPNVKKNDIFTVVFRGMFIPATGVEYVLEAAKIFKDEPIKFLIIGWGQLKDKVVRYIEQNNLKNVELITVFLKSSELRRKMLSAHIMLGQFSGNSRLDRTIQHKTIEALALGMPYVTRESESNRELLEDGKNCLFVHPADTAELVQKIKRLQTDKTLRDLISSGAFETYLSQLERSVLGKKIWEILRKM